MNDKKNVIWRPQAGSQDLFLQCPYREALYEGNRGAAKTDALIMDFAQYVGRGFGPHWRGILFRRTFPELDDIIDKTRKWFPRIFPQAKYNVASHTWKFRDGEELLLRHFDRPTVYDKYHGHSYPWIGWDELTTHPTLEGYLDMFSCNRSGHRDPKMPRHVRSTTNPWGVGHNAVKERFVDPAEPFTPITDEDGRVRIRIHGSLAENRILLQADPEYLLSIKATQDPNKRKAWLHGDWEISGGGVLDGFWDAAVDKIPYFEIPGHWPVFRTFDYGQSKPFSVGYWAVSDGCDVTLPSGQDWSCYPGTYIRVAEIYGWNGKANKGCNWTAFRIAEQVREVDSKLPFAVQAGAADSSIFAAGSHGQSIADEMASLGVTWEPADKGPGSRKTGLALLRNRLGANKLRPMESAGLFVMDNCRQWLRTVPTLPPSDTDPDDAHTDAEDHAYDETRYLLQTKQHQTGTAEAWF